jgi:hypothetical protein
MWWTCFNRTFIPTGRQMGTEGCWCKGQMCQANSLYQQSFSECTSTQFSCAVILLKYKFITLTVHNFIYGKHILQALGRPSPLGGASWIINQTFYTHDLTLSWSSSATAALTQCKMAEFPSAKIQMWCSQCQILHKHVYSYAAPI